MSRRGASRNLARLSAGMAFIVFIAGLAYFAILVFEVRFGEEGQRAAAYRMLGKFLGGQLSWYQDVRVYVAVSLLLALISILFGLHPLARVTVILSGATFLIVLFFNEPILRVIERWAQRGT